MGWQIGTGGRESVSKIKAPKLPSLGNAQISGLARATKTQVKTVSSLAQRPVARRYALHMMVAAAVAAVVISGNVAGTAKVAGVMTQSPGMGAVLDAASAASVAANVADKTALPVAADANQAADTLNAQVALPTAGDDYLAKRQVVATSGANHSIITYAVADGDTLSGIANKFDITTSTLESANNLSDDSAIKPGQKLTILPISGLLYTVSAGDTAASLASKYQSNAAQIISFNNAEVSGLAPGQSIIIPDGVNPSAKPAASTNASVATSASSKSGRLLPRLAFSGNGYAYGYCTYYVASRRYVPSNWGNAYNWYYAARAAGYAVGSAPAVGAIAWTPSGYYGHVAYVESVSGGSVTVSEMNYGGGWNRISYRTTSASEFRYIY